MINKLTKLSDELDMLGLYSTANSVDNIIKKALMGPDPKKIEQMKQRTSLKQIHALLDLLGLIPVLGEGADLSNAALYLSQGITNYNLLMAGLSITSMVPTMGDVAKAVKYGSKLAPDMAANIASLILRNQGKIKAAFDRLKDANSAQYIVSYIKNGNLLTKYADQMWNAIKGWFHKILDDQAKQKIQEQVNTEPAPTDNLEGWAISQLPAI